MKFLLRLCVLAGVLGVLGVLGGGCGSEKFESQITINKRQHQNYEYEKPKENNTMISVNKNNTTDGGLSDKIEKFGEETPTVVPDSGVDSFDEFNVNLYLQIKKEQEEQKESEKTALEEIEKLEEQEQKRQKDQEKLAKKCYGKTSLWGKYKNKAINSMREAAYYPNSITLKCKKPYAVGKKAGVSRVGAVEGGGWVVRCRSGGKNAYGKHIVSFDYFHYNKCALRRYDETTDTYNLIWFNNIKLCRKCVNAGFFYIPGMYSPD